MAVAAPGFTVEELHVLPPRRRFSFLRDLMRRKLAVVSMVFLLVFYGAGIFAPWIAPRDPNKQELTVTARSQGPSSEHYFGTDGLGRDLASRVMYAARTTIIFTVLVVLGGSLFIGLGLGLLAGYRGGWIDTAILRVGEVLSGIPTLILMLAISAAFRSRISDVSFWLKQNTPLGDDAKVIVSFAIIIAVSLPFGWIGSARIVRGQALSLRESEYITAAESIGASSWRIVWYHLFPGVLPLWLVGVSAGMAGIALTEVGLSYLGLGIEPPGASFGTLIADGSGPRTFQLHPHLLLFSATPVILFSYAWNLLGDAMVDIVQPRQQRR
jgi:ABC-type dipeptide/oligopeptide/nickel transport system permease subunit